MNSIETEPEADPEFVGTVAEPGPEVPKVPAATETVASPPGFAAGLGPCEVPTSPDDDLRAAILAHAGRKVEIIGTSSDAAVADILHADHVGVHPSGAGLLVSTPAGDHLVEPTEGILDALANASVVAWSGRVAPTRRRSFFCLLTASVLLDAGRHPHDLADGPAVVGPRLGIDFDHSPVGLAGSARLCRGQVADLLRAAGLTAAMRIEMAALPAVQAIERAGIRIDREAWTRLLSGRRVRLRRLTEAVTAGFASQRVRLNLDDRDDVVRALHRIGVPVVDATKAGLRPFTESRLVRALLERWRLQEFVQGIGGAIDRQLSRSGDGRVRGTWDPLASPTGRMSCSEPPLLSIPRDPEVRSCFVPVPGCVFVVADYAHLELRVAADWTGDARLIKVFSTSRDPHAETAAVLFQREVPEVTRDERQAAKAVNFGLLFGMGAKSLAAYASDYGVDMDIADAHIYIERFLAAHGGLRAWQRRIREEAPEQVRSRSGRLRVVSAGDPRGQGKRLNMPIQGTAADGMKVALALLHRRLPDRARIVLVVHDEVVVECPARDAAALTETVRSTMVEGMASVVRGVPVVVETDVRTSLFKE